LRRCAAGRADRDLFPSYPACRPATNAAPRKRRPPAVAAGPGPPV